MRPGWEFFCAQKIKIDFLRKNMVNNLWNMIDFCAKQRKNSVNLLHLDKIKEK